MIKKIKIALVCLIATFSIFQLLPFTGLSASDSFGSIFREIKQQLRQYSNNGDLQALEEARKLFDSMVEQSAVEDEALKNAIYESFEQKQVDIIPFQILQLGYETTKKALNVGDVKEAGQWFEVRESKLKFEKKATPAMKAIVELKKNPSNVENLKDIIIDDLKETYLFKVKESLNEKDGAAYYYFAIIKSDLEKEISKEDFQTLIALFENGKSFHSNEEAVQKILNILHTYESKKISETDVKSEAEKIGKLIQYIHDNWSVAIKDGEIFNGVEFAELKSFLAEAKQRFLQIKPAFGEESSFIDEKLNELEILLLNKESQEAGQKIAQEIVDVIIKRTNVQISLTNNGELNIQEIEKQLAVMFDEAVQQYKAGKQKEAYDIIFDSYFIFEPLEKKISAMDQSAVQEIESAFALVKGNIQNGLPIDNEIQRLKDLISQSLIKAEAAPSNWELFIQSLIIIIREGFEAILIIGALVAYMLKTNQKEQVKYIYIGSIGAVIVSFIAAYLIRNIFKLSGADQEALEGVTMLIAVFFLFYVSYWLISKVQGQKWQEYIKGKLAHSVSKGNLYTMSFVAFLAVFREGFETILFYEALLAIGDDNSYILYGFLLGCIALTILYLLISKYSIRIPIKPFFTFTSTLLYLMAFSFAGHGIFELQEGGYIPATFLSGWPTISLLGIYPTVETLSAQAVLLLALIIAIGYFIYSSSKHSKEKGVLEQ